MTRVGSLFDKCLQLGIPVDFANLTRETKGLAENQISEIRLENLILTKNLEMSEQYRASDVQYLKKRLAEVSTKLEENEFKINSYKNEIKTLKATIYKLFKNQGAPKEETNRHLKNFDIFDWRQIASIFMLRDPIDESSPPELDGFSSEVPQRYHEKQEHDGGSQFMVNLPASTSGSGDRDPPAFQEHSSIDNATTNPANYGDSEISVIQLDEEENEEERSLHSDDNHAPEAEEPPAQLLAGPSDAVDASNIGSDILSLIGTENTSEQAGSSGFSKTKLRRPIGGVKGRGSRKVRRKQWLCKRNKCKKVFNSKTALYFHQQLHRGINGEIVPATCDICQKTFCTLNYLKVHQKKCILKKSNC